MSAAGVERLINSGWPRVAVAPAPWRSGAFEFLSALGGKRPVAKVDGRAATGSFTLELDVWDTLT